MGKIEAARELVYQRRRKLLILHMTPDRGTLGTKHLTNGLRRLGFDADSNSTNADMRWFRRVFGIELSYRRKNSEQDAVDKIIEHWKANRS